jgi:hypothetical protein
LLKNINNPINFRSQVKHGIKTTLFLEANLGIIIKTTQLLSVANLSMVSKQLNYFQKPTKA